jgi:hypothetical protein
MKRLLFLGPFLLALCLFSVPLSSPPIAAQEGIEVISDAHEYRFGEYISFRLTARSQTEIVEIVLTYRVQGTTATNRGVPDFVPAKSVDTQYTWRVGRGGLTPASEIEYQWHITDAQGNTLQTEPRRFIYHDQRFQWQSMAEGGITLYWYDMPEASARTLMSSTQRAFDLVEERIGLTYTQTAKVVVYLTKDDMLKALVPQGEVHEQFLITLGTLSSRDTVVILGTHPGVADTLAHELTHLVVHQATENPFGGIPAWLDEGLAMYTQGMPPEHRAALARAIRQEGLISLRSLSGRTGRVEDVDLFYAESHSVAEFLIATHGKEKMLEFLAALGRGLRQETALVETYGLTLDRLDAQWRTSLGLPSGEGEAEPTPVAKIEGGTPVSQATPEDSAMEEESPRLCASILPGMVLLAVGGVLSLRRRRMAA